MSDHQPRLLAILSRPGARFAAALEAAWEAGDAVLPLDPRLPAIEAEGLLGELRPHALMDASGEFVERPDPLPVRPGIALVVPTSGTTRVPKGVELTHDALVAAAEAAAARIGTDGGDRWLCCLPLHHIAGLMTLVRSRFAGSSPLIQDGFDTDEIARANQATLVSLVPTMLSRLLQASVDLTRFRCILVGGGPVDGSLLERARTAGARAVITYGMTETCGGVVYDGVPLDNVDVALSGRGEISIAGPMIMSGYRGRPDLTARVLRDGRLRTKDLGTIDQEGRLVVLGRTDGVIITGGNKVLPSEVEEVLLAHSRVREVSVVGEPHADRGQEVVALIVATSPSDPPTLEEITTHCADRLAVYKRPTRIVLVENL
jgi:O-succinylbenzoic acid--CoA ligase